MSALILVLYLSCIINERVTASKRNIKHKFTIDSNIAKKDFICL